MDSVTQIQNEFIEQYNWPTRAKVDASFRNSCRWSQTLFGILLLIVFFNVGKKIVLSVLNVF